jgi:acetoin utilization protein AcuB
MNAITQLRVMDLMTAPVISVSMDTKFVEIRHLMELHNVHHLPVVDQDKVVGIISDRDMLRVLSPFLGTAGEMQRDLDSFNRVAHQIMTRQPICVAEEDSIEAVLAWLKTVDISCVLVTDKAQLLKGIITWRDLLKHAKFSAT